MRRFIGGFFRIIWALLALISGAKALGFLAALIAIAVKDVTLYRQPLGQVWFQNDPFFFLLNSPSIQLVQVFFERKLQLPQLWDPVVLTLLNWPAWAALGLFFVISFLFMLIFIRLERPKRRQTVAA